MTLYYLYHIIYALIILYTQIPFTIALNTWIGDNDTWWQSTSDFMPIRNTSYGELKLRDSMYMQFDATFNGPTPAPNVWQNVFRVGFKSTTADCYGQGSRYPSLWIMPGNNLWWISISEGDNCLKIYEQGPGSPIGKKFSFRIWFNETRMWIKHKRSPWTSFRTFVNASHNGYDPGIINTTHPRTVYVWISTDQNGGNTPIPAANVTLSNIYISSFWQYEGYTIPPTLSPTLSPTTPTNTPSSSPSVSPTASTNNPSIVK